MLTPRIYGLPLYLVYGFPLKRGYLLSRRTGGRGREGTGVLKRGGGIENLQELLL